MRKQGMTLSDALSHVKQYRPSVDPNPAFLSQLESFEKQCIQQGWIGSKKPTIDDQGGILSSIKRSRRQDPELPNNSKKKRVMGPRAIIGPAMPPPDSKPGPPKIGADPPKTIGPEPPKISIGPSPPPPPSVAPQLPLGGKDENPNDPDPDTESSNVLAETKGTNTSS